MTVETEGLTKYYWMGKEKVVALDGVDLQIEEGEFISLVGPSGSGKSTFLHILGCLDVPTKGEVYLDGAQVNYGNKKSLVMLRRKFVGFVFQTFNLIPALNALENVEYPMYFNKVLKLKSKSEREEKAMKLLELVGLKKRANHLPSELSGGEQQRVAIARALANDPKLILADEPTGNLDSKTGQSILNLLKRLNNEEGKTIIMVTHDLESARRMSTVIRILDGRIQ
ncbi:lipoprotein-releasing system ATP-binding protein LolD [ANME-1 cluster archaeon GoMg4]|nr:lipoprotein-releasing system ATP-binding protein LolD [ANME-1 cluster archaeon GoMg4]